MRKIGLVRGRCVLAFVSFGLCNKPMRQLSENESKNSVCVSGGIVAASRINFVADGEEDVWQDHLVNLDPATTELSFLTRSFTHLAHLLYTWKRRGIHLIKGAIGKYLLLALSGIEVSYSESFVKTPSFRYRESFMAFLGKLNKPLLLDV